ncbi:hypothetical protein NHX12_025012 [Muraenolepis orangiensis]|uniref:Uncharacterized protein n=1 Tax=Muraenolepis orangiensis TaxID=630683 RepID=A0A9Q0ISY6_9TELE|nr:hypothetical protein NHX12_025012 [Muraenolepis orangiensis]
MERFSLDVGKRPRRLSAAGGRESSLAAMAEVLDSVRVARLGNWLLKMIVAGVGLPVRGAGRVSSTHAVIQDHYGSRV